VRAEGKSLVGHAGAVLLRRCADRTGLTGALGAVFATGHGPGWWDRGVVLVELAVSIVLGAVCMSDIDLLAHQAAVFGDPPSDSTVEPPYPRIPGRRRCTRTAGSTRRRTPPN
jgi:hypothetical protein